MLWNVLQDVPWYANVWSFLQFSLESAKKIEFVQYIHEVHSVLILRTKQIVSKNEFVQ